MQQRARTTTNPDAHWSTGLEYDGLKFLHLLFNPQCDPIFGGGMQLLCGSKYEISPDYCHMAKRLNTSRTSDYAALFAGQCHPCKNAAASSSDQKRLGMELKTPSGRLHTKTLDSGAISSRPVGPYGSRIGSATCAWCMCMSESM